MLGLVGALLGGTIGAYMPANTTFTPSSIAQGLTYELNKINSGVAAVKEDAGLGLITALIPALGAAIAQQPNLARGPSSQEGPFRPPIPLPTLLPPVVGPGSSGGGKADGTVVVPLPGGIMEMSMGKPKAPVEGSKPDGTSIVPLPGGVMEMSMGKPKVPAEGSKPDGTAIVPLPGGIMEMNMGKPKDGALPVPKPSAEGSKQAEGSKPVEGSKPAEASKPAEGTKPTEGSKPADSKPKGDEKAETEMAPPHSAGPPKPAGAPPSAEPKAQSPGPAEVDVPKNPAAPAPAPWTFPGLEEVKPVAAPVTAPTVTRMEGMSGYGHGGRGRR